MTTTSTSSSDWHSQWRDALAGQGCGMCADQGQPDNGFGIRYHERQYADAYLIRSGVVRGYTVAIWNGRHVAEPTQLAPDEAIGYWSEILHVARAIESVYQPAKIDYLSLGNGAPHLHFYLIPRYTQGDPAPNRPLPFTFLDDGRQDEDRLQHDVGKLAAAATRLSRTTG